MSKTFTQRFRQYVRDNPELATIYAIMFFVIGLGALLSPEFRTPTNAFNVLRQAVALGLVSIGQTIVILVGGIDLSVGATISLVAVYTSGLMAERPWIEVVTPISGLIILIVLVILINQAIGRKFDNLLTLIGTLIVAALFFGLRLSGQFDEAPLTNALVPVLMVVMFVALAVGGSNAMIVSQLRVPAFIATLGIASVVQGFVLMYAKHPSGRILDGWEYFAEGMIGPVPFPVVFLIVLVAGTVVLQNRTALGRHIIATGGNEEIARLSGIQINRVTLFAFVFCSFTAALTGLFLTSRMAIGDPQVGGLNYERYDLDSIAAVLIGGTRLGGGKGTIMGTIAGVLILATLNNIFNLVGISTYYQWLIKGFIVLAAVAIYAGRD
jgi:ribose/xylose/arabinose/galactoside ABC-type transport system permease subunit